MNFSSVDVHSDGHLISVERSHCTHDISIMLQKDPNHTRNLALILVVQMMISVIVGEKTGREGDTEGVGREIMNFFLIMVDHCSVTTKSL